MTNFITPLDARQARLTDLLDIASGLGLVGLDARSKLPAVRGVVRTALAAIASAEGRSVPNLNAYHLNGQQVTKEELLAYADLLGPTMASQNIATPALRGLIRNMLNARAIRDSKAADAERAASTDPTHPGYPGPNVLGTVEYESRISAAAPLANDSLTITLTAGDVSNLLHALDQLSGDLAAQAFDPSQANVHALCELKLAEVQALRAKLCADL